MRAALKYQSLWDVMEGKDNRLELWERQVHRTNMDLEVVDKEAPTVEGVKNITISQQKWDEKNNKAVQTIILSSEDGPAMFVEDEKNAYVMWNKLESLYLDTGFTARHNILQQLMTTTYTSSNSNIETYVQNIRAMAKKLSCMGAGLPEWVLVSVLLNNLDGRSKDFTYRVITRLGAGKTPDFEDVVSMLKVY